MKSAEVPLPVLILGAAVFFGSLALVKMYMPAAAPTAARLVCPVPTEWETRLIFVNATPAGVIDVKCGPAVGGSLRGR